MKIQDYKIIKADGPSALETLIKDSLRLGWVPQGGVSVIGYPDGRFYQAMIKNSGD